jgi:hypothetical protein
VRLTGPHLQQLMIGRDELLAKPIDLRSVDMPSKLRDISKSGAGEGNRTARAALGAVFGSKMSVAAGATCSTIS